jgi:antibiotic biosynthesis monooxygenase (ABM) superfamily enzyme
MPFGLELRSVIVGLLLAYFLIPWVQSMLVNRGVRKEANA